MLFKKPPPFKRRDLVVPKRILYLSALLCFFVQNSFAQTNPLINEFVFDHTGGDTEAFIEVFGDASTDYSGFTLLEIDGDGTSAGVIDAVLPIGTTNADGYWVSTEDVENGNVTLLLVSGFSGSLSDDLDTDNDGTLDSTPWDAIIDGIGVDEGGSNYASVPVLSANFDGISFDVGGASRIPNGIDTDAISDWTRNDFSGEGFPGFTGTPEAGEAINTPGAVNEAVPATATDPLINEFVFDHTGGDTEAFIEVFGDASTDYSGFTLLEIDGDGTSAGVIDAVLPIGTTNADGYWVSTEDVENGNVTLLLVSGFSGSLSDDLDTDNDGTLDSTPWDAIIDGIGVDEGGSNYASVPVLSANFDGISFDVGGASRIPNGTDTDATSDWTRNDFDGEGLPGFTGTPEAGEALNTPGAANELVPAAATNPIINEFVFNHDGSDTEAFIEIFGDPSTDYSAFTLLEIEGDDGAGIIDAVIPLGTTNANGYFTDDEDVENGTVTLLLVSNFTGSLNDDLDTDNDGILDSTPWDAIVDAVGVNDGGGTDANHGGATVLLANFDGGSFTVGGASRIPNGTDTDATSDWTRNDFDGEGLTGFTGTPEAGEALNTPGATNELVPAAATNPIINEFVFNHDGSDTEAFIEIFGDPSTDYSAFTLLEIEGDDGAGIIDAVIPLGTTNANGYFTDDEDVENGTVTLLLVSNFTGSLNDDLDTDNDGTLDSTPWDAIVDAVGVNDGGGTDANHGGATVLLANFDGGSFTVGGASRIPNGRDTDATSDWTRNDFDGEGLPGFTGTPEAGEALNTPGAANELVPAAATNPIINEFVFNHDGSDTEAFIEIFGDPSTDYSAFTLLEIEGDDGAGIIDAVIPLGTTNADGYFTDDEDVENGTVTLLLVSNFTGSLNDDLDTDDDGTLDSTPWDAIIDAVGVNDGGGTDANHGGATVLLANFDGGSFTVGGASRIPNGTDTDAISDWTRNDFDGEGLPGFTGTPETGEALNTPGAINELASDQPPIIVTLTPANGATDVDVATNLIAEFNEDIQAGTGNIQLFILVGDILVESFDVSTSPLVSIVGNTLTIDPTLDLDPAQTYYVTLDAGVVEDLSNNDFAGFADNTFWSFTTDDGLISFVGQCPSFVESFESAPGTSYTLSDPFDDGGFDFFNRYAVPDNSNGARNDFQAGWAGSFGILSQDNDGEGGAATRTITIGPIDISGAASPVGITGSFGALNGEPEFDNYEGGDGIQIFADIDGTRTLIGAFAPDASGAGDLYQDTNLDGTGDGVNLTTTLTSFSFAAPSTGTSLTLEIELTSNDSFEPLAVDNIRVDCESPAPVETKIHLVQGSGSAVTNPGGSVTVEGVVVGDYQGSNELRGFFLQEETTDEDGDPNTSEGIFVYCGSCTDAVSEGQIVQVTGRQGESGGMSQIDISLFGGSLVVTNAGDNSGLVSPASVDMPAAMSTEDEATFENVEGMLVQFTDELTVTEYFQMGRFGQIVLSEGGKLRQFTNDNMPDAAGFTAAQDETARRRIILDDLNNTENNTDPVYHPQPNGFAVDNFIRGGYTISNLTGIMDYASPGSGDATWRIRPQIGNPVSFNADNPRTAAPESVGGSLKVASFNVLNYFTTIDEGGNNCGPNGDGCRGANSAAELVRQRDKIVAALEIIDADVVGLIELENNPAAGPANDGTDPVLEDLVNALNAKVGAGTYDFIDAGVIGTDVIKVAFIYKPATVSPTGAAAILDASVDPRFDSDFNRPALAQTFTEISSGEQFTPIVNHFKSKGSGCGAGDDDTTTGQGNCNGKRTEAAEALVDWLATDPTGSGSDNFLIIGDLNAYALEDPIKAILEGADDTQSTADDYTDLVNQFVGDDAYSFVFSGEFGYLDHALATGDLLDKVTGATIWHINSDEVNLLDYNDPIQDGSEEFFEAKPVINELYDDSPYRSSDHDPVIVGLQLAPLPCLAEAGEIMVGDIDCIEEVEDVGTVFKRLVFNYSVSGQNIPDGYIDFYYLFVEDGDQITGLDQASQNPITSTSFESIALPATATLYYAVLDPNEIDPFSLNTEDAIVNVLGSAECADFAKASFVFEEFCNEVCEPQLLSLNKPTQTPCDYGNSYSGLGVDGITEGSTPWTSNPDIVHVCQEFEDDWWQVDLGDGATDETFKISEICIYNRSAEDEFIINRLKEYYLLISCSPFDESASLDDLLNNPDIYAQFVEDPAGFPSCIQIPEVVGQYVRIQKPGRKALHFAELEVYGCPFEAECGPQPDPCAQLLQPEIVPAGPFHATDAPEQLMALPAGGTWTGPGVNSSGVFDPGIGVGSYAIAYTLVDGDCEKMDMIQIEVLDPSACTPTNLALGKDAEQSSTYGNGIASIAVDGDIDGTRGPWAFASIQHTQRESMPWWKVDLGESADIESIKLFNRTDCCSNRLKDFYLFASEAPIDASKTINELLADASIANYYHEGTVGAQKSIEWPTQGRYVAIKLTGKNPLHMAEVQVMGCPAGGQTDCVFEQPTITGIAPSNCATNDGKIEVLSVSGTDYEYSLSPTVGWQVPNGLLTFFGLDAGIYTVYIRDRAKPECVTQEVVEVIPDGGCGPLPCTSPENLAMEGVASQSSTYGNGEASFAIDGNTVGTSPWTANLQHTQTEAKPWWMVDLGDIAAIEEVKIYNRSNGFQNRLKDFYVFVSESPIDGDKAIGELTGDPAIMEMYFEGKAGVMESFDFDGITGQYVLVKLTDTNPLHMAEVEVLGCFPDLSGSRFADANSGIAEEARVQLAAYPNPFSNSFTLDIKGELAEIGRLQLVNALGQIIEERQVSSNETLILGHGLAKGIYFVQLRDGENIHQLKVVKLR